MTHRRLISSLMCLGIATPALPVLANNSPIEEVLVTARKRAESLQEVPMAVSAFSSSQLETAQVDDITDLQRMTPNVTLNETSGLVAGAVQVFIRGIGNDPGFDQGVGIYLDDIYLNRTTGALLKSYDIERIEVLKGPQGNLYGRNTIGGAVKYVTRKPGDELMGDVKASYGAFGAAELSGSVSGPINSDAGLYGSAGFLRSERDALQRNRSNGEGYWDEDVTALRGSLLWRMKEGHELTLAADIMQDNSAARLPERLAVDAATLAGIDFVISGANNFFGPGTGLVNSANDTSFNRRDVVNTEFGDGFDDYEIETTTLAATYQWDINDTWSFKSVTARRTMDNTQVFDFDGTDQQFITTLRPVESEDFSQEFQFNYSSETLSGVIGAYYLDGKQDYNNITEQYERLRAVQTHRKEDFYDRQEVESKSVYGSLDWDFASDWQLSTGLRFTKDSKAIEQRSTIDQRFFALALIQGFPPSAIVAIAPGQEATVETSPAFAGWATPFTRSFTTSNDINPKASESWHELSPTVKLSHFVSEDTLVYGGVASGFKAGGFQNQGGLVTEFDPETVMAYTLGVKTTMLSGRLQMNAELFYNDYQDKQFAITVLNGASLDQSVDNVGEMTTEGGELEMRFSATDSWLLGLNVGYLNSTVKSYKTQDSAGNDVDIAPFTEIGFSPEWNAQLNSQYVVDIRDYGTLTAAADVSWRTSSYTNSPIDKRDAFADVQQQEEHHIVNASVAFETQDRKWRVAVEGKNLEDKRVLTNSYVVGPFVSGGYNSPRTWAVSLRYSY